MSIDVSSLAADPTAPSLFTTPVYGASTPIDDGGEDRFSSLVYSPPPSLEAFFVSEAFASLAVGPVGSLKTTAGVMKIAYEAKQIAPCRDGIRRTRYAWIRNCYDEETEILTPEGWVRFADLGEASPVATLVDGALVWEVPKLHYLARHSGKMIGLRAQGFDLLVTPDHELWMSKAEGQAREWQPYTRTKAYEAYGKGQMYRMRTVTNAALRSESWHEPIVRKTDWYTVEDYDGMVHCVEVSSGVVLVRRNGKAVWCGQTREMLRDTSIPDFLQWYPDGIAGTYLKSEMRYTLRFDDVECEILFRGLDDADDVRRLLSMQLTGAIMDEFREINPSVYKGLASRLGRYPNKRMNIKGCRTEDGRPAKRIWGMSNPPDYGTFWEELLSDPPENVHVTIQPSGVSPEADWIEFLDQGYYENLMELHKNDQDWIDVYVHAKFGASLSGKPVFRTFNRERHVAKDKLNIIPATIIIAVDPGVACTSAVIGQATFDGRVLIHDAIYSLSTGAARFIDEKLRPLLAAKYASCHAIVVMDPAGRQRAASDENTAAKVFKSKGFKVKFASTNALSARIASVETFLNRSVNDNSALLIAPHNMELVQALAGKYRYKVKKNGDVEDEPEKLHPISDLADCVQYLCMEADGGETLGRRVRPPVALGKVVSPAGWT